MRETRVSMTYIRHNFRALLDMVHRGHRVVVHRYGKDAAYLVDADEFRQMEQILHGRPELRSDSVQSKPSESCECMSSDEYKNKRLGMNDDETCM